MNKAHETMIKKYGGYEGYRQHMREVRSKVKNHPGGAFKDPEFAKLAQIKSTEAKYAKKNNHNRASAKP